MKSYLIGIIIAVLFITVYSIEWNKTEPSVDRMDLFMNLPIQPEEKKKLIISENSYHIIWRISFIISALLTFLYMFITCDSRRSLIFFFISWICTYLLMNFHSFHIIQVMSIGLQSFDNGEIPLDQYRNIYNDNYSYKFPTWIASLRDKIRLLP